MIMMGSVLRMRIIMMRHVTRAEFFAGESINLVFNRVKLEWCRRPLEGDRSDGQSGTNPATNPFP